MFSTSAVALSHIWEAVEAFAMGLLREAPGFFATFRRGISATGGALPTQYGFPQQSRAFAPKSRPTLREITPVPVARPVCCAA